MNPYEFRLTTPFSEIDPDDLKGMGVDIAICAGVLRTRGSVEIADALGREVYRIRAHLRGQREHVA